MRARDGSSRAAVWIWQMRQLALVAVMGCSLATSGAPPNYDGRAVPDCTTSQALPVIDTTAAIVAGVIGVPLMLTKGDSCDPSTDCHDDGPAIARGIGTMFVVVGALYALGAYVGFSHVSSCNAAIAKHQAVQAQGAVR